MLILRTIGPMRVLDEDGTDLAPSGRKARAILALLAFSPGRRRARAWIQDRLWSDRSEKQGAESLRQALSDIRRSLGDRRDALTTGGGFVELAPEAWTIDVTTGREHFLAGRSELFEDLDIRDPEFEHWIRDCRAWAAETERVASPSRRVVPTIVVRDDLPPGSADRWIVQTLSGHIAGSLLEHGDFNILGTEVSSSQPGRSPAVALVLGAHSMGDRILVMVRIERLHDGAIVWQTVMSGHRDEIHGAEAGGLRMVREIVDRVLAAFAGETQAMPDDRLALGLFQQARRSIFSFDETELNRADRLLAAAHRLEPRAQFLSWRYFLRNNADIEFQSLSCFEDRCDPVELAREALRSEPTNSLVLGFAAQAELVHRGNRELGMRLARDCIERNPGNAIGWAVLSNGYLQSGEFDAGDRAARMAERIMAGSDVGFFWDIFSCMAATAVGDFSRAVARAERAVVMAPAFRPPRRYLVALYKHIGSPSDFERACAELRELEPDFEPTRLLDPAYPATTLQRLPLAQLIS
jgi:DNA-binding SARP family transcriptional activator